MTAALPEAALWPQDAIGEALGLIAARLGEDTAGAGALPPPPANDPAALPQWIGWAGARLGIEALPVTAKGGELAAFCAAGPALAMIPGDAEGRFVVLLAGGRSRARLLAPDGRVIGVPARDLVGAIAAPRIAAVAADVERVLDAAALSGTRRDRAQAALVQQRIAGEAFGGLTLLRLPAAAPFGRHARQARLPRLIASILALFTLLYLGEILGWRLIGSAGLDGRLDSGWLLAWLLLIVTLVPGQSLARLWQERFAQDLGRLIRSRLLAGALALAPDAMRREGVGGLIGRVLEAEALESMVLSGGMALLVALIELALAGWVLSLGAAPGLHLALLGGWIAAGVGVATLFHRRIAAWTARRLGLTADLIAAMIGHRTRLAQQDPAARDRTEDAALAGYAASATAMDRAALMLNALLGPGWSLAALAALGPALAGPGHPSPARLAVSLGGILLAQRAIGGVAAGFLSLSRAGLAWQRVGAMVRAGSRAEPPAALPPAALATGGTLVRARGLRFGHQGAPRALFEELDLAIAPGERVLVEGPSGGGKSTLAALLAGLREPELGLLTVGGLDRQTLGGEWHRHVGAAPQFHENHVLSGTLAFNLLMGRGWPASPADLAEAAEVCEGLGLGDLIRRMPAGLHQRVGETGCQLSHGERSRVFLARAILAGTPLTILDESFGPLDPETLETCLATTLRRTDALMVIAHP